MPNPNPVEQVTTLPAAVVYLERPSDGRVLALTRGADFADWQLPGGSWDAKLDGYLHYPRFCADGQEPEHDLQATARREVSEETGIRLPASLRHLMDHTARNGCPVRLYVAAPPVWCPVRFPAYPAGQPAWVPPEMLVMPSCSFAVEAAQVLAAVRQDREWKASAAEIGVPS